MPVLVLTNSAAAEKILRDQAERSADFLFAYRGPTVDWMEQIASRVIATPDYDNNQLGLLKDGIRVYTGYPHWFKAALTGSARLNQPLEFAHYLNRFVSSFGASDASRFNELVALARQLADASSVLFLGRHVGFPVALEGALKLKELAYMHAEGFAAGELKHGPIALIDENMPVIVIAPYDRVFEKTVSNMQEVAARGGHLILIGPPSARTAAAAELASYVEVAESVSGPFAALGTEPVGNSAEACGEFLRAEIAKWTKVVRAAGAKAD